MTGQLLEGVLAKAQRDSLEIVDFIFHIIEPGAEEDERVVMLDEVFLEDKQKTFFLDRLRDIAEGTQYEFQQNAVHLKEKCQQLIDDRDRFVELSCQITQLFAGHHTGRHMAAGVLVVSVVKYLAKANDWRELVFLVKMDQQPSFTYRCEEKDGKRVAAINEIPNALNESKNAIQKSALIDVSGNFAWDALAFDRMKRPDLSDYFRGFLGVIERHQDSTLTRSAHLAVRKWAKKIPLDQLPPDEDLNTYLGRSLNYLKDHDTFDTEGFLNAVVRDGNPERKAVLMQSLHETLAEKGIAGQQFRPQPNSLRTRDRKQTYLTFEGVTLTFEGPPEDVGMRVEQLDGESTRITIETRRLDTKD